MLLKKMHDFSLICWTIPTRGKEEHTAESQLIMFAAAGFGPRSVPLTAVAHAMAGCDITWRLYGNGKGVALQKLNSRPIFNQMAEVFCGKESCGVIVSAGEMALSSLYGAHVGEGLDALRYRRFYEKVSKSSKTVQLQSLPPTSAAVFFHNGHAYLQVQHWMKARRRYGPRRMGLVRVQNRQNDRPTTSTRGSAEGRQI